MPGRDRGADRDREAEERRKLRGSLLALSLVPPLFGLMSLFSDLPRGPWIGLAFGLIPVVTAVAIRPLHRPGSFRPSHGFAGLWLACALSIAAFVAVAAAHVPVRSAPGLAVQAPLLLGLALGLMAGRYQLLEEGAMRRSLTRRLRAADGVLEIHDRHKIDRWFRASRRGDPIDMAIRLASWAYAGLVILGAVFGGGAGLIILALLAPRMAPEAAMGLHATAMTGLGALAIPVLGYLLPALWRAWRMVRQIEAEARDTSGQIAIRWV